MIIGAHMSITNGYAAALAQTRTELDANAMQIFLKSPRGGVPKPLQDSEVEKFKQNLVDYKIDFVVGHSSYLLNLAKPIDPLDDWQSNSLYDDLTRLSKLGGGGLVYHVGKFLKLDYDKAEQHLVENLKRLLARTEKLNVPLLLENCAGQGSEMGTSLEQIASVMQKVDAGAQLKVCLDTCHAFAAGYDLRDKSGVDSFFNQIKNTIGIESVVCFHLNDSKFPLSCRKDRHANLGVGEIGKQGILEFVKTASQNNIPLILETPLINDSHLTDLNLLKTWL